MAFSFREMPRPGSCHGCTRDPGHCTATTRSFGISALAGKSCVHHSLTGARTFRNGVLSSLPPQEIERIRPYLSRMRLVQGQTLYEPSQRVTDVFFIEQGFVSMIAQGDSARSRTETALISDERG